MQYSGCSIDKLEEERAQNVIKWLSGEGEQPTCITPDYAYLLAHCDDGIIWGYFDEDKQLHVSSGLFGDRSPHLLSDGNNLKQLRLFGSKREILIWKTSNELIGRTITDNDKYLKYLEPRPEKRIVLGNRLAKVPDNVKNPDNGFSLLSNPARRYHIAPILCSESDFMDEENRPTWPLRLELKHYFEQDKETGTIRIFLSRLVRLYNSAKEI